MHIAVNNILVWYNSILIETLSEYYLHVLDDNLGTINRQYNQTFESIRDTTYYDCYESKNLTIQTFSVDLKPYLYPGIIL